MVTVNCDLLSTYELSRYYPRYELFSFSPKSHRIPQILIGFILLRKLQKPVNSGFEYSSFPNYKILIGQSDGLRIFSGKPVLSLNWGLWKTRRIVTNSLQNPTVKLFLFLRVLYKSPSRFMYLLGPIRRRRARQK